MIYLFRNSDLHRDVSVTGEYYRQVIGLKGELYAK